MVLTIPLKKIAHIHGSCVCVISPEARKLSDLYLVSQSLMPEVASGIPWQLQEELVIGAITRWVAVKQLARTKYDYGLSIWKITYVRYFLLSHSSVLETKVYLTNASCRS